MKDQYKEEMLFYHNIENNTENGYKGDFIYLFIYVLLER
jgi:hypothetical protein